MKAALPCVPLAPVLTGTSSLCLGHEHLLLFRPCAQYVLKNLLRGVLRSRACHFASALLGSGSAAGLAEMLGNGSTTSRDSPDLPGGRGCNLMALSCMELVSWGQGMR